MSPIKTSTRNKDIKYIEGRISDGKDECRFVSFDTVKNKKEIEDRMEKGESVKFRNCAVKRSRNREGYEVVMSVKSSVASSPKRFKISDNNMVPKVASSSSRDLDKLECVEDIAVNVGVKVGIRGKMVSVKDVVEVKSKDGMEYRKQDCVFSDGRKGYRLVLWQNLVNKVESGACYRFGNVLVKSYQGLKYFSTTADTEVTVIDDIGEVCGQLDDGKVRFVGEIVGIESFTEFAGCVTCNSKVCDLNNVVGHCSKCGLKQKMDRCKKNLSARVVLEDDKKRKQTVSMFSEIINLLIDDVDNELGDVETQLLCADSKEFEINSRNVVTGFATV